jgi:hypothetical protein
MTKCNYCEENNGTIQSNLTPTNSPRIPYMKRLGLPKRAFVEHGEQECWCEDCYRERADRFEAKGFDVSALRAKL